MCDTWLVKKEHVICDTLNSNTGLASMPNASASAYYQCQNANTQRKIPFDVRDARCKLKNTRNSNGERMGIALC
jgi:hypothetical protein